MGHLDSALLMLTILSFLVSHCSRSEGQQEPTYFQALGRASGSTATHSSFCAQSPFGANPTPLSNVNTMSPLRLLRKTLQHVHKSTRPSLYHAPLHPSQSQPRTPVHAKHRACARAAWQEEVGVQLLQGSSQPRKKRSVSFARIVPGTPQVPATLL